MQVARLEGQGKHHLPGSSRKGPRDDDSGHKDVKQEFSSICEEYFQNTDKNSKYSQRPRVYFENANFGTKNTRIDIKNVNRGVSGRLEGRMQD